MIDDTKQIQVWSSWYLAFFPEKPWGSLLFVAVIYYYYYLFFGIVFKAIYIGCRCRIVSKIESKIPQDLYLGN